MKGAMCVEAIPSTYPRREFESRHVHFNGGYMFESKTEIKAEISTLRTVRPKDVPTVMNRNLNIIRVNQDEIPARIELIRLEMQKLEKKLSELKYEESKLQKILQIVEQ